MELLLCWLVANGALDCEVSEYIGTELCDIDSDEVLTLGVTFSSVWEGAILNELLALLLLLLGEL